jgi:hypothetical protein
MTPLKKKVGPLPVWGWMAAVALGVAIYYWQKQHAGNTGTVTGPLTSDPTLDPTQGGFDYPSALSGGGTSATDTQYTPATKGDFDNFIYGVLPFVSAPGQPQEATNGAASATESVTDTVAIIKALSDAGLVNRPATSTGASASTPQKHTAPAKPIVRVNTDKGNPRKGMTYVVVNNPRGHPKGVYHVYNMAKGAPKYVKVK